MDADCLSSPPWTTSSVPFPPQEGWLLSTRADGWPEASGREVLQSVVSRLGVEPTFAAQLLSPELLTPAGFSGKTAASHKQILGGRKDLPCKEG